MKSIAVVLTLMLASAGPAAASQPPLHILDCTVRVNANWIAELFHPSRYPEDTAYTIHLDTRSGEWFLSNAYAAAFVLRSGRFDILRDGTGYPPQWLGLDHAGATQMRIETTHSTHPFLFVDDNALYAGRCSEPDEIFLFLR